MISAEVATGEGLSVDYMVVRVQIVHLCMHVTLVTVDHAYETFGADRGIRRRAQSVRLMRDAGRSHAVVKHVRVGRAMSTVGNCINAPVAIPALREHPCAKIAGITA